MKINLLVIVHSVDVTNRILVGFCRSINRSIFEIKVLAHDSVGGKEKDLSDMGIEYVVANGDIDVIAETIKKWQIDAIYIIRGGGYSSLQLEIFRRAKIINPKIVILETNFFGRFDPKSWPLIDCSLQVSKMMLNGRYLKEGGQFDFDKVKILYHPLDCQSWDKIYIGDDEVKAFKNKLGIKEGDFVIGKLGRPAIEKWSDLLVYMMPYLVKLAPNIKFIVQEMPDSRKKRVLRSKYKDHYILLKKTLDDREVALFYKTIDVYTHASKIGESFGMTLAEAGAFRKPVIVNSTPHRDNNQLELVEHMKTGIIANHPQTFARAVEYLYKNKDIRMQMGEAARAKIVNFLDPKKLSEQLEKVIIEKMVKNKQPLDPQLVERYSRIEYYPSEAEILAYKEEYQKRLKQEFGKLSVLELLVNYLNIPRKFYFKLRDFAEHKFGI